MRLINNVILNPENFIGLIIAVLVVTGDTDRIVPAWNAERVAHAIPRASFEVIKSCGHLPQEERPEEFLSVVGRFLQTVFRTPNEQVFQAAVWYTMLTHTRKHKFADWRHEEKYCKAKLLKMFSCNCEKFRGPIGIYCIVRFVRITDLYKYQPPLNLVYTVRNVHYIYLD